MTAAVRGTGPGNPATVAARGAVSGAAGESPGPPRSPLGRRILLIAVFLLALANGVAALRTVGRWHLPPVPGDGQDYDNIALNLVRARGFGQFWDDPEWRAPYLEHNEAGIYDGILARSGPYSPTAYRPPVLPAALAATYALFGRSFLVWGLIHALIAAAALTIAAHLALRLGGLVPALILLAMALWDRSLMYFLFACPMLTEGWSCLAVGLFTVALARIGRRGAPRDFVLGGAALGLLVLVRGIFVMWYPFAALGILALALWQTRPAQGGRRTTALALCSLFLAGALLVPMPWWIRNCAVTGKLMPLGTQGGINLPIGYSDSALASGGVWTPDAARRFWAEHATPITELEDIRGETAKAEVGQRAALAWARSNLAAPPAADGAEGAGPLERSLERPTSGAAGPVRAGGAPLGPARGARVARPVGRARPEHAGRDANLRGRRPVPGPRQAAALRPRRIGPVADSRARRRTGEEGRFAPSRLSRARAPAREELHWFVLSPS